MGVVEERLHELGIEVPSAAQPVANYVGAVRAGRLLFLSGSGPARRSDGAEWKGKVGRDLTADEGYQAARRVGLSLIANLRAALGDLDRVQRVVRLVAMVNAVPDFAEHSAVVDGCSDLLVEVFGDAGRPARTSIGMSSLPFEIPVEIEMIVEVKG